jgi:hypothetical protein
MATKQFSRRSLVLSHIKLKSVGELIMLLSPFFRVCFLGAFFLLLAKHFGYAS